MATIVHGGSDSERRSVPRRNGDRYTTHHATANLVDVQGMSVSWGGIWGGVLIGMGLLLLLTALGLALGVTAVDPNSDNGSLGIGAAVWAAISLLLALYTGGMVSTRIGAIFDKTTGMFEGILVWVLSLLLIVYLAGSGQISLLSIAMPATAIIPRAPDRRQCLPDPDPLQRISARCGFPFAPALSRLCAGEQLVRGRVLCAA